jgi:hypothetical protein
MFGLFTNYYTHETAVEKMVSQIATDFKAGNWNSVGVEVGTIIRTLLVFKVNMAHE